MRFIVEVRQNRPEGVRVIDLRPMLAVAGAVLLWRWLRS